MQSRRSNHVSAMLYVFSRRLRRLCSTLRWLVRRRRPHTKLVIRRLNSAALHRKKLNPTKPNSSAAAAAAAAFPRRPIRVATFNAALFSLAPAVPAAEKSVVLIQEDSDSVKIPRGILKQSPLHPMLDPTTTTNTKSRPKVSINLPENEISLAQSRILAVVEDESSLASESFRFDNTVNTAAMRSPIVFPAGANSWWSGGGNRTVYDVLKEVGADILSLQDVKADEANDMKPLSELARALGMTYVFAESWAPEFGNAVLSRFPIKKWRAERICDDRDFRCVQLVS